MRLIAPTRHERSQTETHAGIFDSNSAYLHFKIKDVTYRPHSYELVKSFTEVDGDHQWSVLLTMKLYALRSDETWQAIEIPLVREWSSGSTEPTADERIPRHLIDEILRLTDTVFVGEELMF